MELLEDGVTSDFVYAPVQHILAVLAKWLKMQSQPSLIYSEFHDLFILSIFCVKGILILLL